MIDLFIASVHDAGTIFSQDGALTYISQLFMKRGTIDETLNILMNYFLPPHWRKQFLSTKHIFLGHMVYKMLRVVQNLDPPSDRDNFQYKRIETSGTLIRDLFREHWIMQNQAFFLKMDKELYYHRQITFRETALFYKTAIGKMIDNIPSFLTHSRVVEKVFPRGFVVIGGLANLLNGLV